MRYDMDGTIWNGEVGPKDVYKDPTAPIVDMEVTEVNKEKKTITKDKKDKPKVKLNRHQRRAKDALIRKLSNQLKGQKRKPPRCPTCRSSDITYMTEQNAEKTRHYTCLNCERDTWAIEECVYAGFNDTARWPRAIHSDGKIGRRNRKNPSPKIEVVGYH